MTAQTPGQAAPDLPGMAALAAAHGLGAEATAEIWESGGELGRAHWRAIADAAIMAARLRQPEELRQAMAETRQLREQLAAMAARWKDQAAMHDRDADRTGSRIEAAALAAKSRVYTGNADEVLETIGVHQ